MIEIDPDKTVAVVVGVEKYDYGKKWNLNGPASDAISFVKWLRSRGVPAKKILLFLSPLDENQSLKQGVDVISKDASRDLIQHALAQQLNDDPALNGDLLFLFWGGHGVMEADQRRRLFLANATEQNKLNFTLDSILQMLRSKDRKRRFKYQIGIIDACANYFEEMRHKLSLADSEFSYGDPDHDVKQFVMYAAAAGERAKNEDVRRTGAFSEAVLKLFGSSPLNQWPPDVKKLNEEIKATFVQLRKEKKINQTPVYFAFRDWDGNEDVLGNIKKDSELLWDVSEIRPLLIDLKVTTAQLRQMYVRSIPDWQRAPEVYNLDQILRTISGFFSRREGTLPPLLEFVERTAQLLNRDDLSENVVSIWQRKGGSRSDVEDLRLNIQNEDERLFSCYLLIDVCDPDLNLKEVRFPAEIRYWVITDENPYGTSKTFSCQSTSETDIRRAILTIIKDVESRFGRLFVELFVHHCWLRCDIDQWRKLEGLANPFFEEDELEEHQPRLGDSHHVVLRWGNRAMEANDAASIIYKHTNPALWQQTVKDIKKRQALYPDVFWVTQEQTRRDLEMQISKGNNPPCTGFSFIPYHSATSKTNMLLLTALVNGTAFAIWPRHTIADENDFKKILCNTVVKGKLDNLPRNILELRQQALNETSHPGCALTLLWDDPDRNPLTIPTTPLK